MYQRGKPVIAASEAQRFINWPREILNECISLFMGVKSN